MTNPTEKDKFLSTQAAHARQCAKEAKVALAIWLFGLIVCCSLIVTLGYIPPEQRPVEPSLMWGMPAWVFYGLFVPWFVQIALTWWFALFWLKDDEPFVPFPESDDPPEVTPAS